MAPGDRVFPPRRWPTGTMRLDWAERNGWGADPMPRRLIAFLTGAEDAVPGDYVLALAATLGLMAALIVRGF